MSYTWVLDDDTYLVKPTIIELPNFPTHVRVVKASKKTGLPVYKRINIQSMGDRFSKGAVVKAVSEYLDAKIPKSERVWNRVAYISMHVEGPNNLGTINVDTEGYYKDTKATRWDLDNLCNGWYKWLIDALVKKGYFVDDNIHYIRGYSATFQETESIEDRKITITIWSE